MNALSIHPLLSWVLAYLLNSLWQAPLVFVAAWMTARILRQAGPRIEHRVWVAAMLFEVGLPACQLQPAILWQRAWSLLGWRSSSGVGDGSVRVVIGEAIAGKTGFLHLPEGLSAAFVLAYACSLIYFSACLGWGLWKTAAMRRAAVPEPRLRRAGIEVSISPMITGPSTIGFRRAMLLLPPVFLDSVSVLDLEAALAHEYAHIKRHDFAKNVLYQLLSLPIAYHPALRWTLAYVAETREMICDATAAEAVQGQQSYARSLLRLASMLTDRMPARTLHAIGMFDANNFERRIMNLIEKRNELTGARRMWIGALCGLVAIGTCASALALRVDVSAPESATTGIAPKTVHIRAGDMAGNRISGNNPVYPKEAKASGKTVDGTVVLAATISKDGLIEHLSVKKSLRDDYDQSAKEAVQTWHYRPYLLNGEPVAVETTINITYSIKG